MNSSILTYCVTTQWTSEPHLSGYDTDRVVASDLTLEDARKKARQLAQSWIGEVDPESQAHPVWCVGIGIGYTPAPGYAPSIEEQIWADYVPQEVQDWDD